MNPADAIVASGGFCAPLGTEYVIHVPGRAVRAAMLDGAVVDATPLDHTPDSCWRCDARKAATDVGLCERCHADLTDG